MTRYADTTDLTRLGLPATALTGIATEALDDALDAASAEADSYLRARYVVPFTTWGADLKQCVAALAAETILTSRGYNPEAGRDDVVSARAARWRTWLRDVSAGKAHVSGGATTPTAERHARACSPRVMSNRTRGW